MQPSAVLDEWTYEAGDVLSEEQIIYALRQADFGTPVGFRMSVVTVSQALD